MKNLRIRIIKFLFSKTHSHRLSKELVMYEQEVTDGEAKLVQMKEAEKDEYDIRKYVSNTLYKLYDRHYLKQDRNKWCKHLKLQKIIHIFLQK